MNEYITTYGNIYTQLYIHTCTHAQFYGLLYMQDKTKSTIKI